MKLTFRHLAVMLACASSSAWSADTYLNIFYDKHPLQGVEVKLDGRSLGKTDALGSASSEHQQGKHTLELFRDDVLVASVDYQAGENQDVEISVSFSAEDAKPVVSIHQFSSDDQTASGTISGVVTEVGGAPVSYATITVAGTEKSVSSDSQGLYSLKLPRGTYDLVVEREGYAPTQISDIRVVANIGIAAEVKLRPLAVAGAGVAVPQVDSPASSFEEVVVLGTYNPTETTPGIERFSAAVTDAIDVFQLERFGDSSAASALTRIVGVTVNDDKYANVRGLDGRYISSTLNGLVMPSTDPMRRDVQLDLFPSSILAGVEIQKSYSPELLGTTTGGSVKLITRGIPEELTTKVSVSGGFNPDVTGEEIVSYEESNDDWIGYDSGLRDLPGGVLAATNGGSSFTVCDPAIDPVRCTAPIDAARLAVKFQDDYNIEPKKAVPDSSVSLSHGNRLALETGDFGYYAAASYKHTTKDRLDAVLSNTQDLSGEYSRSQENVALNGYLVFGYESDANEILSKTIILRNTDNTTRVTTGVDTEDNASKKVILEWVERQFITQQFSGAHRFDIGGEENLLEWRVGYSETERDEPDRRTYTYLNDQLAISSLERRWSELSEDSLDLGVDYTLPITFNTDITTEIKLGGVYSDRSREVDLYRFGIIAGDHSDEVSFAASENLESVLSYQNFILDRVRLSARTASTDSYDSDEELSAYYLSTQTEIGADWTLVLGARQEKFDQSLSYPNEDNVKNELNSDKTLPAFSLTYRLSEEFQIRGGYSQTVSYPGIIERSESLSYDPVTDDPIFGNPDLEVSTIDNYDLRFEYYFSDSESISIAYFSKEIDKPIERAVPDASGSAADGITFRNSQSADITGVEIDATKNIFETDSSLTFVSGNISYFDSEVTLDEDSLRLEGSDDIGRDLQGQSPWLANIQIGFDHFESAQKLTLLVNYFDDRIYRVTRGSNNGPEYEKGRAVVNLNYEKLFGDSWTFKFQIKNLLDSKVEWEQNGTIIESYKEGVSYSMDVSYEF